MVTEKGFIIQPLESESGKYPDYPTLRFNNLEFVIIPVQK
jgi:hypothetical protein